MADTTKKIIRGEVNSRGYTITSAITQWDYGYVFVPEFENLPATYRLDFSNDEHHGTALPVYCGSEGGEVPEKLIDTGKDIFVWFFYIGDGFGKSEYKWRIPNKCKPKTEQDEPSPSQQSSIDQAIAVVNEAVETVEEKAEEADTSAQSAQGYAEQAESARDTAQTYANNAQTSATSAQTSASQASASASASAQSASQSTQIKADVEELVDDAQGYANASAQSATASANSASQAQGYANNASASAQSASGYASSAQTSANTASAKAQDASGYAQTASQKATESAQSASQALGYKTDAESAKTASQTAQGLAEGARDSAISAKNDAEQAKADAESARDEAQQAVASISDALMDKADIITDTASGSIASFSDGADDLPLKSLVVNIDPVQDLSQGDPSPENICPISGWTQVGVEQRGKNLLPIRTARSAHNEIEYTVTNEGIRVHGTATGASYSWATLTGYDNMWLKIPAGTYTFSVTDFFGTNQADGYVVLMGYDYNDNALTNIVLHNGDKKITRVFTSPVGLYYGIYVKAGLTVDTVVKIQAELDSTATPYEPYTGRSITIDLGQTVYGGKLDVLSGVLTVDRAMVTFDGTQPNSNFSFDAFSNYTPPRNRISWTPIYNTGALGGTHISDTLIGDTAYVGAPLVWHVSNSGAAVARMFIGVPTTITSVADWQAYVSEHPISVVYKLAEPITIQLTPNQVNSLYGVNNLWADSGDTMAEYRANTKLYIAKKIAEAISALS